MASLPLNPKPDRVRCLIRGEWLTATPEEVVRQRLLRHMTEDLGYPRSWLCVEKRLTELPHLALHSAKGVPKRRVDVLCYAAGLSPLILIECKAVPVTARAVRQVIGYNRYVGASYICIVNTSEIQFGGYDHQINAYRFGDRFPSFAEIHDC